MHILCSSNSFFISYCSFFRVCGSRGGSRCESCLPKIRFLTSFCSSSFLYSNMPWKSFSFRGMLTGRIGSSMICPGDMFSIWPTAEGKWKKLWNVFQCIPEETMTFLRKSSSTEKEKCFLWFRITLKTKTPVKQKERLLTNVSWGGIPPLKESRNTWTASTDTNLLLISWIISYKSTKSKR